MAMQILKFLVAIFIFSRQAYQQNTPLERCETSSSGFVCTDCFQRGTCVNTGGVFTVESVSDCPIINGSPTYCDDTIANPPDSYGQCSNLPSSYTNCSCFSITQECILDPNDPAVVLHCDSDPPVADPACAAAAVDLSQCSCVSCPGDGDCPLVDDPNDDCASLFYCEDGVITQTSCQSGLCFNQTYCTCLQSTTTSTSTSTSTSSSTTTVTPVPNCPLIDDPTDDCSRFYYYDGTELYLLTCASNTCFNQTLCGCVDNGLTTTKTTTTNKPSITCPSGCPFADDPDANAACGIFYICDGGQTIQSSCPGTLCFNQAACQCV